MTKRDSSGFDYDGNNVDYSDSAYGSFKFSSMPKNRNETDFKGFNSFYEQRERDYTKRRSQASTDAIKANVADWDSSVPRKYRKLSLRTETTPPAKKLKSILRSMNEDKSLFIYSPDVSTRERLVYSFLRDFVFLGFTSFPQVSHFYENDLTTWATIGFTGNMSFNDALNNAGNFVIVHGFSDSDYSTKEVRFLEKLINHCFHHGVHLVFSSNAQLGAFERILSPASFYALKTLVSSRVLNF